MQVKETKSEGLTRDFTILVPASDIDARITAKLNEVSANVNIPGFRPGKAPMSLLRQRYGANVMGEVLEAAVQESSQKVMNDNELKPAMQPKIEVTKFEDGSDLEYTMNVEVLPEIKVADLSKISVEKEVAEIDQKEIDEVLERIQGAFKSSTPIKTKRKTKKGDVVLIKFVGKVDGEEFDGGAADDYELELGSGSFIPGFEDQLIGKNAGDAVEVKVKFPDEYGAENLAGKDAVFDVDVKEIRESVPAELNDELAKKVGKDTMDELIEAIKEDRAKDLDQYSRAKVKRQLFDALDETHDFELPAGLIEQETKNISGQYQAHKEHNPEEAAKEADGKSDEEMEEEFKELAQRRVKLGLLMAEIGQANDIKVGQDEINKAMMDQARNYPGQEQMIFEFYQKNPQMIEQLTAPLFEDKVVDFILEMAKVKEKKVSLEDLMKEPEDTSKKKPATKKASEKKVAKKPAAKKPAAKKAPAKKAAAKKDAE